MAVHPVALQKALGGVGYPASKQELIDHAREQDAGENVIEALEGMEDREYQNPTDVNREIEG